MSPRAAARLESYGLENVFDYVAGKADWSANGLPTEGEEAAAPHAAELADRDVPLCRMTERCSELRARAGDRDVCVVVNADGFVLGSVSAERLRSADGVVEDVMDPGPSTVRPDADPDDLLHRLERSGVERVLVTTGAGRLIGVIRRADLAARPPAGVGA